MDALLQQLTGDPWGRLVLRHVAGEGLLRGGMFVLVAARLTGFLCIGPLLGRSLLTWPVRLGLIVLLTLVVAPTLPLAQKALDEVKLVAHESDSTSNPTSIRGTSLASVLSSPADFGVGVLFEVSLGAMMGLGVAVLLSGLKLGGEWLDRHSGFGLGGVFNPEFAAEGSAAAEMLLLFGLAAILLMEPSGGHLLLVRSVLETFHSTPVGSAGLFVSPVELLGQAMRQSLVLGLRVAMPLVVAMSLVDMTLGFISRSSRQSLLPTAYAARTAAALLIFVAIWPGVSEALTTTVLESLRLVSDQRT